VEGASVLEVYKGKGYKGTKARAAKRIKERDMCNWIDCDVCFSEGPAKPSYATMRALERDDRDEKDGEEGANGTDERLAKSDRDRNRDRKKGGGGKDTSQRDESADGTNSESSRCSADSHSNSTTSTANTSITTPSVDGDSKPVVDDNENGDTPKPPRPTGQLCSKCKLVKYCSPEHQKLDWEEHRRVCIKMNWG